MHKRKTISALKLVNSGALVLFLAALYALLWNQAPMLADSRAPASISHP